MSARASPHRVRGAARGIDDDVKHAIEISYVRRRHAAMRLATCTTQTRRRVTQSLYASVVRTRAFDSRRDTSRRGVYDYETDAQARLHAAQRHFHLPCGQPLQSTQLRFSLPCRQGLQCAQSRFSLPCRQGLQFTQLRFTLPCGQGLQSAQSVFSLPCGHRFTPITNRSRLLQGPPPRSSRVISSRCRGL